MAAYNDAWLRSVFATKQWNDEVLPAMVNKRNELAQTVAREQAYSGRTGVSTGLEQSIAQLDVNIANAKRIEREITQNRLDMSRTNPYTGFLKGINVDDAFVRSTLASKYNIIIPASYSHEGLKKIRQIGWENAIKQEYVTNPQQVQQPVSNILSNQVTQIIKDVKSGAIQIPEWFENNIEWVQNRHISEKQFLTAYNNLVDRKIAHIPIAEAAPVTMQIQDDYITNDMVTQQVLNFNIINGRAIGSIKFIATDKFNPYYYRKNIVNLIQFKDSNGANILSGVKTNNLNFTETERDEIIHFDEDMKDNINVSVESFVWEWISKPLGAFSKVLRFNIDTVGKFKTSGIMSAGVTGAIGILILLGFIVDSRRKK